MKIIDIITLKTIILEESKKRKKRKKSSKVKNKIYGIGGYYYTVNSGNDSGFGGGE